MLNGYQAAVVFSLLIVPGFLLVQGYRRGRSYTLPDRDLYVLAQAAVASLAWLAFVWVVLKLFGDPLDSWGVLPWDGRALGRHEIRVAALLIVVEFAPLAVGAGVGAQMRRFQQSERFRELLGWTGVFESPTAWEHAWSAAAARAATQASGDRYVEVTVRLKSGHRIEGRYGLASRVDLAPRPSRQLYLETAVGVYDAGAPPERLHGDGTIGGVYIDPTEIAAIYFRS